MWQSIIRVQSRRHVEHLCPGRRRRPKPRELQLLLGAPAKLPVDALADEPEANAGQRLQPRRDRRHVLGRKRSVMVYEPHEAGVAKLLHH